MVRGARRGVIWIFELFDSPGDFFVTEFDKKWGPCFPLIFPIGVPVSVSSYFGGFLLNQDGILLWSFLHPVGPCLTDSATDLGFD